MSNGPVEPSADLRTFASNMRQMYVALVAEGFTDDQAMRLISDVIAASFGRGEAA